MKKESFYFALGTLTMHPFRISSIKKKQTFISLYMLAIAAHKAAAEKYIGKVESL